ncbi:unnamed protein product [Cyclocybe aegerita]|uniref:Uncharacterized protein n=1 Tax=Cyclocybe aegerita TaxID=1973307 RepID=A0A8S0W6A3_CYCAE|nr:unnamed protein product [Cyclocybe aegerita]
MESFKALGRSESATVVPHLPLAEAFVSMERTGWLGSLNRPSRDCTAPDLQSVFTQRHAPEEEGAALRYILEAPWPGTVELRIKPSSFQRREPPLQPPNLSTLASSAIGFSVSNEQLFKRSLIDVRPIINGIKTTCDSECSPLHSAFEIRRFAYDDDDDGDRDDLDDLDIKCICTNENVAILRACLTCAYDAASVTSDDQQVINNALARYPVACAREGYTISSVFPSATTTGPASQTTETHSSTATSGGQSNGGTAVRVEYGALMGVPASFGGAVLLL